MKRRYSRQALSERHRAVTPVRPADLHFIHYFAVKWIGHSTGSLVVESA
jgi:hypothetical protein